MKFEITNGTGKVAIGLSEIGSYFSYVKPNVTVWHDCHGSVGKYLSILPYDEDYRYEIASKISTGLLDGDLTPDRLFVQLEPLLNLFPTGSYGFTCHYSDQHKHANQLEVQDFGCIIEDDWEIIFTNPIDVDAQKIKLKECQSRYNDRDKIGYISTDLHRNVSDGFYDGSIVLVATQPKSVINHDRVAFYEHQIRNGERPFAVVFDCFYEILTTNSDGSISNHSLSSAYYVLDGHHKLLAYSKLGIRPSFVEITHLPKSRDEIYFDIMALIETLNPNQVSHILKNWHKKDPYILRYLKDSMSKIHWFIKNGVVKEFYDNGQLMHEAFYINDKIEGEANWWHPNGRLSSTKFYRNGLRVGVWKDWSDSGKLLYVQPFNDSGVYDGHLVSYFISGKVRWEQWIKNGRSQDGYSYIAWHENGVKAAELKYLNGTKIEHKNYDAKGKLVHHEEFDSEKRIWINKLLNNY